MNEPSIRILSRVPDNQQLSPEAMEIWHHSIIKRSLGSYADDILANAHEIPVAPGEVYYNAEDTNLPILCIVVSGLTRVYTTSSQGRQTTIRYVGPGGTIGLPVVISKEMPGYSYGVQALTESKVLSISPQQVRVLAMSGSIDLWPLCTELARLLMDDCRLLSKNIFQTVRSRVARHLLDLSYKQTNSLVVSATHQDIADAIASVREVVSRVILEFKKEGLLRRQGNVWVITDPVQLSTISDVGYSPLPPHGP